MSFKIVVDSCCDLTPQMRKDPCFVKVPLSIHANGSVFVDDDTLDQADLLWSMRQSEDGPRPTWTHTRERRGRTSMWLPCPPCSAAPTTARSKPAS